MLIDCWAEWRSPCMGKMDEIKALYKRRRARRLRGDRGQLRIKTAGGRNNWSRRSGFRGRKCTCRVTTARVGSGLTGPGIASPHLLLVDREGILRWYGGEVGLEGRINSLLDAPRVGK